MVLPQTVLRAATSGPALVELKNGDSYSGTLAAVDNLMNIRLEDALFIPSTENKFEKLKECTIRGQFVKFIRFPDDILERLATSQEAAESFGGSSGSRWKGSKGSGKGKGPEASKTLIVPANMIGAIIGRAGETIKRFFIDSGARIEVAKDNLDTFDERAIFISGTSEAVEKAADMILSFVKERSSGREKQRQANATARSGRGRGHGEQKDRGARSGGKAQAKGISLSAHGGADVGDRAVSSSSPQDLSHQRAMPATRPPLLDGELIGL